LLLKARPSPWPTRFWVVDFATRGCVDRTCATSRVTPLWRAWKAASARRALRPDASSDLHIARVMARSSAWGATSFDDPHRCVLRCTWRLRYQISLAPCRAPRVLGYQVRSPSRRSHGRAHWREGGPPPCSLRTVEIAHGGEHVAAAAHREAVLTIAMTGTGIIVDAGLEVTTGGTLW